MSAWDELQSMLFPGEKLEAIAFGAWEDGQSDIAENKWPANPPRHVPLRPDDAKPFMQNWSAKHGHGIPEAFAFYAWTNRRVIVVQTYDGATDLVGIPRDPMPCAPRMIGG